MNLQPSNILYVYNSEDEDSVLLSNEYASLRQIPESNMLGIDTLTKSILNDRKQFEKELEKPIVQRIEAMGGFGSPIRSCILGFRIPSGYKSENGIISSCSALSCSFLGKKKPFNNKFNFF